MQTIDIVAISVVGAIPALLCIGIAAMVFRQMIAREYAKTQTELKREAFKTLLPLRISAYERATLFLERLDPPELIARCDPNNKSGIVLHQQLLAEMNAEYEHNVVQQLYISEHGWNALNRARFDTLQILTLALEKSGPYATGSEYANTVFQLMKVKEDLPIQTALKILRDDVLKLFV